MLPKSNAKVFSTVTKTAGGVFLKEIPNDSRYLRWSWHFPWQVLLAEKQVGWWKMSLTDALHKVEKATIKRSDTEH